MGSALGPTTWQAQFLELAAKLLQIDPEPDAEATYAEAASHAIAILSFTLPATQMQSALRHLEAICDRASLRNSAVRRHYYTARGRYLKYSVPAPWTIVQEAEETIRLCIQSGDLRNLHTSTSFDMVWSELGDSDKAIERMRIHGHTDQQTEEFVSHLLSRMQIASILARQNDPAMFEQAVAVAREALARLGPFPLTAITAHDTLARVLLKQGQFANAETEAGEALKMLESMPKYDASVHATLIHALLGQRRTSEAVAAAERALGIVQALGCVGHAEVELRLAISEAFHAAGDLERAGLELCETLHQIKLRTDNITDPYWKTSYLTRNPYCARAQELAKEWDLDVIVM
jgi:tetratricopeptide (TPR) repeat protein